MEIFGTFEDPLLKNKPTEYYIMKNYRIELKCACQFDDWTIVLTNL